jgi:hypothetical protein
MQTGNRIHAHQRLLKTKLQCENAAHVVGNVPLFRLIKFDTALHTEARSVPIQALRSEFTLLRVHASIPFIQAIPVSQMCPLLASAAAALKDCTDEMLQFE